MLLSLLAACAPPTTSDPGGTTGAPLVATNVPPSTALEGRVVCTSIHPAGGGHEVVEIDPDTGATAPVVRLRGAFGGANSLARLEDAVVWCGNHGPTRVDLATGELQHAEGRCGAIADLDGGLLVLDPIDANRDPLTWYASWEDLRAGAVGRVIDAVPYASRLGRADDGRILTGWHSAHRIEAWDPTTGQSLGDIRLEGFDTWIYGISQARGRLFVVNDGRDGGGAEPWNVRMAEFDPQGHAVADLWLGVQAGYQGLSCRVVGDGTAVPEDTGAPGGGGTSAHSGGGEHSAAFHSGLHSGSR